MSHENVGQNVEWHRVDGRPMSPHIYNNGGRLIIERASHNDAGQYECYVIHGSNRIPVGIADLVVVGKLWDPDLLGQILILVYYRTAHHYLPPRDANGGSFR